MLRKNGERWYESPNIELKYELGKLQVQVSPKFGVFLALGGSILLIGATFFFGQGYFWGIFLTAIWVFLGWLYVANTFAHLKASLEEKFTQQGIEYRTQNMPGVRNSSSIEVGLFKSIACLLTDPVLLLAVHRQIFFNK